MKTPLIVCYLLLFTLALNLNMSAQEVDVQVATQQPPYYVGVAAIVQLTVDGLEAQPEPQCTAETSSPDVRIRLSGISPRIMQRMFQSGNQISRIQEVTHTIQFRVTASRPGEYEIGPFVISQGGTEKQVDAIKMTFGEVPTTDDMKIKLVLPEAAYPDQRVPVKIQWWFAGDTDNINQLTIDATVLEEFQFAPDAVPPRGSQTLPIQTDQGTLSLPAKVSQESVDGKQFTVISAERTLIPNRVGKFDIAPLTATIELVTQWEQRRRSAFGEFDFGGSLLENAFGSRRRAAKVELFRSEDRPITFEVKPFPSRGRPESFAGAVGKGFSIDVTADRTVVRVGDPIRLTIQLRGDGNIQGATLPVVSSDGGLDPTQFRLPEGDVTGVLNDDLDTKEFQISVRVLDESIHEIPSIAYSWFDAEAEAYQTTRSKPIALRVMPAQVVRADSVVSNQPQHNGSQVANDDASSRAAAIGKSSIDSLSGADLAIEPDASRLLTGTSPMLGNSSLQIAAYALGSLCVVVAWVDRKRRSVDPEIRRAKMLLTDQTSRISAAAQLSEKEGAKQIAEALSVVAAEFPGVNRTTVQAVIAECETLVYRPGSEGNEKVADDLVRRALDAIGGIKADGGGL